MKRLNILIWHVHGSYLYYLTQAPHEFYLPSKSERTKDYSGKFGHIPWGDNVHDVPVDQVKDLDLDCVIFQLPHQYAIDQYDTLSPEQRRLPKIYLQHDAPEPHPVNSRHLVDDPDILIVHVTDFNRLMWDCGRSPTITIDHGVIVPPQVEYTGEIPKGIVAINHLAQRGRLLGSDVYEHVRAHVPLDLVGMAATDMPGGLGEVLHKDLCAFESRYRFFFNPARYTSFPLAVCEAMMTGLPVVALATTELATIPDGFVGYTSTNIEVLIERMLELLEDPHKARQLGRNAQSYARERFNIERFIRDWNRALMRSTGAPLSEAAFIGG
jgi:hypothetical protein